MGSSINLRGAWSTFWSGFTSMGNIGNFITFLTIVGVLIIVGGLIKYLWDKRRGGGGNTSGLVWTIVVGSVLAGPNLVIPILLGVIDLIVNAVVNVFNGVF